LKIIRLIPAAVLAILFSTTSAHAQGGCVNSPENPTAVLFLVGSAAVILRNKFPR
jgi:XrtJ-associated TM-motif-TM protein